MALTNKGSKWEIKNSMYVLWGFLPFFNCLAYFHKSSRVENKKWSILGWIALIMNITLLVGFIIGADLDNPNDRPYYYEIVATPEEVDYMNSEQKKLYYENNGYIYSAEFRSSEEYENYKNAYDQWYIDKAEWESQPEIVAQIEEYENFESLQLGLIIGFPACLCVLNFVLLIILLKERPKYLKLLAQSENKSSVTSRINSVKKNSFEETDKLKRAEIKSNDVKQIDINSADEETLSALRGITIIDAKKAIAYREEHGGFNNVDEFFSCINAKPHIIVSLQNQLTAGEYKQLNAPGSQSRGVRKLDL